MSYIIDILIKILLDLLSLFLSWRHFLILLLIVILGCCIYEFLLPLFGVSP
jgi:hypothetical protein